MLFNDDPCYECLVKPICKQMCPDTIEFYKSKVRIRPKHEVEQATGYYWEDDYVDDNGNIINIGGAISKKRETIKKEFNQNIVPRKKSMLEDWINKTIEAIKKGI